MLDDDIEANGDTLARLFKAGDALGLSLWQPALTQDSVHSWKHTQQVAGSFVRPVKMIEVMAPFFSRDALARCLSSFSETQSGWGLDFLWPKLLGYQGLAILDALPISHHREVTSGERRMPKRENRERGIP